MARTLIIMNPMSGDGTGRDIVRDWAADRPEVELRETERASDAQRFAEQAVDQGVELVVAAGGDGTVSGVVNGLARDFSAARLAVVPLGTGNDFIRTAELPWETEDALRLIETGRTRRIDVVRVANGEGTRYLLNAATGGFSHVVWKNMSVESKSWLGPFAYFVAALQSLAEIPWVRATLRIDEDMLSAKACSIVVGNGRYVAGGHKISPAATLDDGQVDLSVVTAERLGQRLVLMLRYWFGFYLRSPHIIFRQARRIEIESSPPMQFISDGEPIGTTPMTFEVLHRVLTLVMPLERTEEEMGDGEEDALDSL